MNLIYQNLRQLNLVYYKHFILKTSSLKIDILNL